MKPLKPDRRPQWLRSLDAQSFLAVIGIVISSVALYFSFSADMHADEANEIARESEVTADEANQIAQDGIQRADKANDIAERALKATEEAERDSALRIASERWLSRTEALVDRCTSVAGDAVISAAEPIITEALIMLVDATLDSSAQASLSEDLASSLPDICQFFFSDSPAITSQWVVAVGRDTSTFSGQIEVLRVRGTRFEGRASLFYRTEAWTTAIVGFASEEEAVAAHPALGVIYEPPRVLVTLPFWEFCPSWRVESGFIECIFTG